MSAYLSDIGLNKLAQYVNDHLLLKEEEIKDLVKEMHPVGSYYWSNTNSKSPAKLFGGTWQPVTDGRFLYAYTSTTTGGSSSVSLTTSHMPKHNHGSLSHDHTVSSHYHQTSTHTHSVSNAPHSHSAQHAGHTFGIRAGGVYRNLRRGGNQNVFFNYWGNRLQRDSKYTSANFSATSTTISANSKSPSATVSNGGSGTSGGASSTSTDSGGSGSASVTLNPSYINAYCWYRSG